MSKNVSRDALVAEALGARNKAIAPYSHYQVGAALLTAKGDIVTAGNIETSTYGLTLCAERVAMFAALSGGHREFQAIAIATKNGGTPCGACRQVLWEFAGDIPVHLVDTENRVETKKLSDLLPQPFDNSKLSDTSDL